MVSGQLFLALTIFFVLYFFLKYRQKLEAGIPCNWFKSNSRTTGLKCYRSVLVT